MLCRLVLPCQTPDQSRNLQSARSGIQPVQIKLDFQKRHNGVRKSYLEQLHSSCSCETSHKTPQNALTANHSLSR